MAFCCCTGILVLVAIVAIIFALLKFFFVTKVSPLNLQSRHVLITGGSKGIGKALALEATRRGANVTIVARNKDTLKDVCDQLKQIGDINTVSTGKTQRAQWLSSDVTKGFKEVSFDSDIIQFILKRVMLLLATSKSSSACPSSPVM